MPLCGLKEEAHFSRTLVLRTAAEMLKVALEPLKTYLSLERVGWQSFHASIAMPFVNPHPHEIRWVT